MLLGLLLAVSRSSAGPLDDPDQAWQRPGFLDAGNLPAPAPPVAPGVPVPGRPTVVFFERPHRVAELCRGLAAGPPLEEDALPVVVVTGRPPGPCDAAATVVEDPAAALAEAYGMRRPRSGGPPVGYAVVDSAGAIRYRTLDPAMTDHLEEVRTMVGAVP